MTFNTFLRHLREGAKNVFRNGWMSVASIVSIIVSLFILGVFILLVLNVNAIADKADKQVQIRTYLNLSVDQKLRETVQKEIAAMPEVSKIDFISKEQGLAEFRNSMGEEGKELLQGFGQDNNPLPDAFKIEVYEPTTVSFVAKKIEALNTNHADQQPIMKVKYGKGTVETLFKVTRAVRNIGFVFVAGLGVMSMFLISNTIRVTILARRREIGIMKLVGATNTFIRGPFFVEGTLIGLIGSVITVVLLFAGYDRLVASIGSDFTLQMSLIPANELWHWGGLLIVLGVLIGMWGTILSMRKFLKV